MRVTTLSAQDNTPKYSNEFLSLGVGARSFALGGSSVAYVDDVTSAFWNPAGLNDLTTDHQLSLMHASYFGGIANYDYAGFASSLDEESKFAVSIIRFAVDDIPDTRLLFDNNGAIDYDNVQFFSSADYAMLLSYARKLSALGDLKVGGNIKIIHRTVGDFAKAWGFGIDLGAKKTFGKWMVGASVRDVFGTFNTWTHQSSELREVYTITGNEIPSNSIEITLPRLILGGARNFQLSKTLNLLATADLDVTFDGKRNTLLKSDIASADPRIGLELGYKQIAFLRLGANQFQEVKDFDGSKSWSFQPNLGVGFKLRELMIDYAFTDVGNQSEGLWSHIFSIKVDFNVEGK